MNNPSENIELGKSGLFLVDGELRDKYGNLVKKDQPEPEPTPADPEPEPDEWHH